MRRQRTVAQAFRGEDPTLSIAVHDERICSRNAVKPLSGTVRPIIGGSIQNKVGDIVAFPLSCTGIPPDILLVFRPRPSLRIGRCPVVKNPPIARPGPTPFRSYPILLVMRLSASGLVDPIGIAAGIDPATTR